MTKEPDQSLAPKPDAEAAPDARDAPTERAEALAESADAGGDTTRRSIRWARVGVEMVAIVFSVLLALVLDDWRQDRDRQRLVDSIVLSLRVELEGNQRMLEYRLPFHEAMLDTLGVRLAEQFRGTEARGDAARMIVPSLDELGFDEGLGVDASFSTSAWQAARATEAITRMPLEQVFLLTGVYTLQEDLRQSANRLRDKYDGYLLAAVEGERPTFAVISFTSALSDLTGAERLLCERYAMLAPRLSDGAGEPAGRCGSGHVEIR